MTGIARVGEGVNKIIDENLIASKRQGAAKLQEGPLAKPVKAAAPQKESFAQAGSGGLGISNVESASLQEGPLAKTGKGRKIDIQA